MYNMIYMIIVYLKEEYSLWYDYIMIMLIVDIFYID
jgi:hypothetical protein